MTETNDYFTVEPRGTGVVLLTISREAENNLLDAAALRKLTEWLGAAERNPELRVIIITGAGEACFASGPDDADLNERGRLSATLTSLSKPVIAAVNGRAVGAGADLALNCHLRVAVAQAVFESFTAGLMTGWHEAGKNQRERGDLNQADCLTAEAALNLGLLNQVAADRGELLAACESFAEKICRNAPLALSFALAAVNRGMRMNEDDAMFLETSLFSLCFATSDMQEGTRAFLEKRPPQFTGR
ncbi:MAG: enoyl-CoA hydratase/isomerase family protein [Blastocatellia bacterium]